MTTVLNIKVKIFDEIKITYQKGLEFFEKFLEFSLEFFPRLTQSADRNVGQTHDYPKERHHVLEISATGNEEC